MKYLSLIFLFFFLFQQQVFSKDVLTNFLIAKPSMPDLRFKETVVLMLSHNKKGALGIVINKRLKKLKISSIFLSKNLIPPKSAKEKEITMYWGGPVESSSIFFIHSSDYKSNNSILSNENFTITRSPDLLFDIVEDTGPKNYLIISGISTWSPGQLEFEIKQGDWDRKLNNYTSIFNNSDKIWDILINTQNI